MSCTVRSAVLLFLLTIGLTIGTVMPGLAAKPDYYTLMDVYQLALTNDAQLAAAQAARQATMAKTAQSRAALLPSLSVSANSQYNKVRSQVVNTSDRQEHYNSHGWGATLKQSLFNLGSWFTHGQAKATALQAEAQFAYEQQQLMRRVAESYFNVLRAEDNLITAIAEEAAVKQQRDQARERYKVGLIAETDVLEAQAAYDNARVARLLADNQVTVHYEHLRTLTHTTITSIGKLDKSMPLSLLDPDDSDVWIQRATASNPRLKAARAGVLAAEENLRAKQAEHAPTWSAFASYNHTASDAASAQSVTSTGTLTGRNDTTVVGVQVTLPVFSGGATVAQAREATQQQAQSQYHLDQLVRETHANVRNVFRTVHYDKERIDARCQGIMSSESALKATQHGYEVGTRPISDVLNAQQRLFAAQRDYLNARYDFVVDSLTLKQIAGILHLDDLRDLNRWITLSAEAMPIPVECRAPGL